MVDPIFQDPELQAKFESQGYVKIPFLTQEEVAHLVEFVLGSCIQPSTPKGFNRAATQVIIPIQEKC
jgi:hypothetical protein